MTPKLLVIEDDEVMAKLIVAIGKDAGFTVAVTSGDRGETYCQQFQPDLIVLDILMPNVDGLEMIAMLKEAGSKTRLILMSGDDTYRKMAEALAGDSLRIVANMPKPFSIMEMHQLLSMVHNELVRKKIAVA